MNLDEKNYVTKFFHVVMKNGIVLILSEKEINRIKPYIKKRKRMTKDENSFLSWARSSVLSTSELIKIVKKRND